MVSILWRKSYLAAVEAGELESPLEPILSELILTIKQDSSL
jgi:hypothetical protein